LRSAKAVFDYQIVVGRQFAGKLVDFVFDDVSFEIRYLAVEQVIERQKVRFHVLPQAVEHFTWATRRVVLRNLQAVELASQPADSRLAA
jgi:hypothetical protein